MSFILSEEQKRACDTILQYLELKDPLQKADAIFVAGGKTLLSAEKAVELYHKGYSEKLVFVGRTGKLVNPLWRSIADEYYKFFTSKNIPKHALLWESTAINTLDEAKTTIPLLQQQGVNPKTLILVTRPYHQRRLYATFTKHNLGITFLNAPADDEYFLVQEGPDRLVAEIERLEQYAGKGDLTKQHIPVTVTEAIALLRKDKHMYKVQTV